MRLKIKGLALASVIALAVRTGPATAAPQANAGVTVGGGIEGLRGGGTSGLFHLGARADVLFLRDRGRDMALGPYVEALTRSFETFEAGGGVSLLVPVRDDTPFVLSFGAFERYTPGAAWQPGLATTVFFGSRSYNFHSWYDLGLGLFAQGRYGLGDSRQGEIIFGAQVDFALVAYPFVFAYEALRR